MCDAVAIAGLVIAAASTTYSVSEQNQTVKAQNKINQAAADEGAALAAEAFKDQAGQARLADAEAAEAAAKDKFNNSRRAAEARETVRVSAGEAGVAGVSVDSLIADFYGQEAEYGGSVDRNLQLDASQTEMNLKGLRAGAIDRTIASRRAKINKPSFAAAGLQIANQGIGAYDNYKYRTDASYRGEG